jgi:diamine N-acetyltransferase
MSSALMHGIALRPTTPRDVSFVLRAERHPDNRPFIIAWSREQHTAALADPDLGHSIIEDSSGKRAGFAILAGLTNPHGSVELRRIVVTVKRKGIGRAALRALEHIAFHRRRAHRLWLDLKQHNDRARAFYEAEGFAVEGVLRECLRGERGYESLVVMSMLASEYRKRNRRDPGSRRERRHTTASSSGGL